jgi:diguanylate cyclase
MKYAEDKNKSAEILRMVLPLMARQLAAFHPLSYALWYEHVAGINPALSDVLEKSLSEDKPLDETQVGKLHAQFIVARDTEALQQLQTQLRTILSDTARSAADAGVEAQQFGTSLASHQAHLSAAQSHESVLPIVASMLVETEHMQGITKALSHKLEASAQEVSSLTERLERAQNEALLDPLSGLKNRRGLEKAVETTFGTTGSVAGATLLMADIDHFKSINDSYGHLLGDKVIRAVAQVMHANIKGRDIAARIGGEEFAILLVNTDLHGGTVLAEQIRAAVARGRIHRGDQREHIGDVTLSFGVAVAGQNETLEQVIARADAAMYEAKRGGRNRVCQANS